MSDNTELNEVFWKALASDRTTMLGALGASAVPARPMTAQADESIEGNIIYYFASRNEGIGQEFLDGLTQAAMTFQSADHSVMASAHGVLSECRDEALIDKLWSPMAGLFYKDGRNDPNLILLRFDFETAEVWRQSAGGLVKAVMNKLLGKDPGAAAPENRGTI